MLDYRPVTFANLRAIAQRVRTSLFLVQRRECGIVVGFILELKNPFPEQVKSIKREIPC